MPCVAGQPDGTGVKYQCCQQSLWNYQNNKLLKSIHQDKQKQVRKNSLLIVGKFLLNLKYKLQK